MLRDLFEGTGVMGALDHAKIEGANDPESLSVDAQAAKVAKRAADALRRSQAQVQVTHLAIDNYTSQKYAGRLSHSSTCLMPRTMSDLVDIPVCRGSFLSHSHSTALIRFRVQGFTVLNRPKSFKTCFVISCFSDAALSED